MRQTNDFDNPVKQEDQELSFIQQLRALPPVLFKRFMKQLAGSIALAIFTVVLLVTTKELEYCWGFLFSIYLAYLGFSLVWDHAEEKIVCKPMVCIKTTRLSKQRMYLILRDLDAPMTAKNAIHQFYVPASKMDLNLITPNTILNVYYDPRSPIEMTGWEIIGMAGNSD